MEGCNLSVTSSFWAAICPTLHLTTLDFLSSSSSSLLLLTPQPLVSINQPWRGILFSSCPMGSFGMWPQWKQVEKPWSTLSLGLLLSPHSPLIKRALSSLFSGGIRWAFCLIIAEWIQSPQTDMFTKLWIGGAGGDYVCHFESWGVWSLGRGEEVCNTFCLRGEIIVDKVIIWAYWFTKKQSVCIKMVCARPSLVCTKLILAVKRQTHVLIHPDLS